MLVQWFGVVWCGYHQLALGKQGRVVCPWRIDPYMRSSSHESLFLFIHHGNRLFPDVPRTRNIGYRNAPSHAVSLWNDDVMLHITSWPYRNRCKDELLTQCLCLCNSSESYKPCPVGFIFDNPNQKKWRIWKIKLHFWMQ